MMHRLQKIAACAVAVTAGLCATATPAHADSKYGRHLVYMVMGNARPASLMIWSYFDGGWKCYNATPGQDIKTNFTVWNEVVFEINYYGQPNCVTNSWYAKRWWKPWSDSNKYWYAGLA